MKHLLFLFFLVISLTLPQLVTAEMYRYVDESGQTRWTDDLSQVPVEQRESVKIFKTIKNEPETQKFDPSKVEPTETTEVKSTPTDEHREEPNRADLEKEKADLDTRYQSLSKERVELEKQKSETSDEKDLEELNSRIEKYNQKTDAYEKQLMIFTEKVNAYNRKLESKPSKSD